ncbi:MAG TPA: hypothetical protein VLZ83_06965 [Edaphocola sp.]|nr:hypothetical protein [Edaphocola sp.]
MSYVILASDIGAYIYGALGIFGLAIVFTLFRGAYLSQKLKEKLFKSSKSFKN